MSAFTGLSAFAGLSEFARGRLLLQVIFSLNAFGIALWFPRIPDVKAALGADLVTLSICFFMLPVGTFIGFSYAPRAFAWLGVRRAVAIWGALFILAFILPALAGNALELGAALLVAGLAIAPVEVGMNAKASNFEKASGRRIMSGCHGFWSFGAMAGALTGGACAQFGISFLVQELIFAPPMALAAFFLGLRLAPEPARSHAGESHSIALPHAAILAVCLLPVGALLLEGGMMEWSQLFLQDDLGLSPLTGSMLFAVFSVAMGSSRLSGDWLAERFGPRGVMQISALLAGIGIFVFASAGAAMQAGIGAGLLGLGCANIYPLSVSLVGQLPGESAERNIGALTLTAFTAFLIGPPLIGLLGSAFGLGPALMLLTPLGLYPAIQISRSNLFKEA